VLHAAGANLVLAARREQNLRELADELGERALVVVCDVTIDSDRERLIEAALTCTGRIDVLVNNAGMLSSAPAEDETVAVLRDQLEVNLVAAQHLCTLAAPALRQGAGSIINITSVAAHRSMDKYQLGAYATGKAALRGLTRELAAQWGRDGIRVNAIAPGFFPSPMTGMLADPEQVAWIESHTALRRIAAPHELDGALLFLASDASTYVTGQSLLVDGGWTAY
jgi:NAD(P)-dependent dehydrogenase (short-subunit alcohol dehydrogenase family)